MRQSVLRIMIIGLPCRWLLPEVRTRGVTIEGADCVEISYPDFFEVLAGFAQ